MKAIDLIEKINSFVNPGCVSFWESLKHSKLPIKITVLLSPSLWQSLDTSLAVAFFAMVIVSFFLRLQGNQQIDL